MGVVSILLVLVGLTMYVKPSLVWTIAESWKSGDATEPSDLYVKSARFGGILVAMAGLGGIVAYWFL